MGFLGYVNGEFGYSLRDPVNHKIVRSKDVIFNEFEMYKMPAGEMEVKKNVEKFIEQY